MAVNIKKWHTSKTKDCDNRKSGVHIMAMGNEASEMKECNHIGIKGLRVKNNNDLNENET